MKKFFLKSLLFIVIIFSLQLWVMPIPKDIYRKSTQLERYFDGSSDILYFGDSTTFFVAPSDKVPVSMQGILQKLTNKKVAAIANAAFDMNVFYTLSQCIINQGYRPKMAVVPINIRSFGPEWDSNPSWQFSRDRKIWLWKDAWQLHFFKPLTVFKYAQPPVTQTQYENMEVYDENQFVGRVKDLQILPETQITDDLRKKVVIFHYFFPLSEDHPKIKVLEKMAELYKENGIQGIFYITPVNYEAGEYYGGARFKEKINEKVQVIKTAMAKKGVDVLDFSSVFPEELFGHSKSQVITEHLTFRGRVGVIAYVLEAVKDKRSRNPYLISQAE